MLKKLIIVILLLGILSGGGYYLYTHKSVTLSYKTKAEANEYVRFQMEAYDSILANYWAEPTQYNLPNLMKLSLEKASGKTFTLATSTREGVADMLFSASETATSTEEKKNLAVNTLIVLTYNLEPMGRNGILSEKQEKELRQNVSNINPSTDLYSNLGLAKGASLEDVKKAYQIKNKELKASTSPEAKVELEKINYANKVLTDNNSKFLYDSGGVEPTVFAKKIDKTLYLYVSKISPTTLMEFARAIDNASTTKGLDSMILDMRGNVGGSLDFSQHFLGLFTGQNQYAFDLFHQGKYDVQRTAQPKFPELDRFGEVAIVTDNMTQSTAEVISATFKRLHLGKTIGTTTRGWGTVENTYPLGTSIDKDTKYSLFLVNSITLRDDNQPIEGRGVDPDIKTTDSSWKSKINQNFHSVSMIKALLSVLSVGPQK